MKNVSKLRNGFLLLGIGYLLQLSIGCANIVPPSGGPKDTLAPYLIAARPKDSATHVQPKEILIGFNEFITTSDMQSNLIVSPNVKNTPLVESKLNALRIRINDSLLPNTTYSLQFGNAIKDVNEGNIAKNFTYVFSTGATIDTGRIYGYVKLAETGGVDSTLLVALHPANNDTSIFKNSPLYYTKVNGKGRFEFKFLPNQSFQLFALPNDYNKKYDDSTKLFAFHSSPIQVGQLTDTVKLYAFQAFKKIEKKKPTTSTAKNTKLSSGLKYTRHTDGGEQDILQALKLSFDTKIMLNDSFPILLCDTLNKPLEGFKVSLDSVQQNVLVQYPWEFETKFHLLVPQKSIRDSLQNILIKSDTISFKTKSEQSYGTVLIRLSGLQYFRNPVLLLTQDDKVKYSYPLTQPILRIPQILPGDFIIKILEDENNNGIWDTGLFSIQKKQPEIVHLTSSYISIRSNWENEFNIILNK
jgi:hypothetical protein